MTTVLRVAMSERRLEGARPLRLTGVGVFGCMAILAAAVAQAAIPTDWDGCNKGYPPEKKIAACTKIINNQSETTPDRIKALVLRAWGHNFKNEYDAAYDDIGEAIKLDPNKVDSYDARASMMASAGEVDRPIVETTPPRSTFSRRDTGIFSVATCIARGTTSSTPSPITRRPRRNLPRRSRRIQMLPGLISAAAMLTGILATSTTP